MSNNTRSMPKRQYCSRQYFFARLDNFFFSRIMYAIKVLLPRAKTKMFNAEFAFVLSSDSGKMSVHACKFLQAQRNGTDNISFVTLLRENGDFFKIPIVCFNFARIRLNQNR